MVFYKNVDILLKAFKVLSYESKNIQLVIVGDGPLRKYLENLAIEYDISNVVHFVGNVSNEDKIKYLSKCSALALPSTFEGFGLVILEAFLMRKPVLVSNVKPFDEIVDDDCNGFLIDAADYNAWAGRIKQFINDKETCQKMGESGYFKYFNKFDFIESINKMELMYLKLIKKKNSN